MKKFLLTSALLAAGLTASAQVPFTDGFKVTFEGREVQNGETLLCTNLNEVAGQYECDVMMYNVTDGAVAVTYTATYDNPSFEVANADRAQYGTPSLCYVLQDPNQSTSNCMPGDPAVPAVFSRRLNPLVMTTADEEKSFIEWQFHVMGTIDMVAQKFTPHTGVSKYAFNFNGFVNAEKDGNTWVGDATEPFTFYIEIGELASVEGITDDANAPKEYFDFTGRRGIEPAQGQMLIVRQGSKTYKTVIR